MDNAKYPEIKQAVLDVLSTSNLKNIITLREVETVYPANVEADMRLDIKIGTKLQAEGEKLRDELYNALVEKVGDVQASQFMMENFNLEVGLVEGDKFEGLEVNDIDWNKVSLKHSPGQVLMIDFWATWCGYCQEPMQENVDIMNKLKSQPNRNISIVGVSCDEDIDQWKGHIMGKHWTDIPQYNKIGILKEVGVRGIPCIGIVGKDGTFAYWGHPGMIHLEETLLNLSEDKPVAKVPEQQAPDSNAFWRNLDSASKMDMVATSSFPIKDAAPGANFCMQTKYSFDPNTNQMKHVKTVPMFYGQVTQKQYDNLQSTAIELQEMYNFNDFAFNVRIIEEMLGEENYEQY